ncbi:MAG: alanine--tRNA ligase [Nanoarchaeota archaeon]
MKTNDIREKYLQFFQSKGHAIIQSAPLVPENDPTTLFTGSGMQPMVPYLLGEKHPMGNRIVDSQKCFRAGELDDDDSIGDNRHTTFFEMLGNWSLADYFKKEQITWIFEFLTKELHLDPKRIYVSVYRGNKKFGIPRDEEAVEIWQKEFKKYKIDAKAVDMAEKNGMQGGRIFYYNEKENWWSRAGVPENMPIGEPGGPDSEMFWDFGAHLKLHENSKYKNSPCHPACDCGRFLEIGNNVFMQYKKTKDGFEELSGKNIDFGGGLERLSVAVIDNPDVFMGDLFELTRKKLEELSKKKYGINDSDTRLFRIIMDHIRASTFLIADGVCPSNKDQGYFTRRLIRRAIRFGYKLGIKENFTKQLAKTVIATYKNTYIELLDNKSKILEQLEQEEKKFQKTLIKGEKEIEKLINKELTGIEVFNLLQTYGYPKEITLEVAKEKNIKIHENIENDFKKELKKHQELSRIGSEKKFKAGLADSSLINKKYHTATHLLLSAIQKVLKSNQIRQKGSNITDKRLRFDFNFDRALTNEEKIKIEEWINNAIQQGAKVEKHEMDKEDAKKSGVIADFWERYPQKVSIYKIGNYSKEICGGPHVDNIKDLGTFKIIKEQSSSSGVRRIKAILK